MQAAIYSTYQAKSRLSELLREVRAGATVRISHHGKVVAELRPVTVPLDESEAAVLTRLEQEGKIRIAPSESSFELKPIAQRPGALARFLAERD